MKINAEINDAFKAGFDNGADCFSANNPHIPSAPVHTAFEAGRYASHQYEWSQINHARMSRGYTVRCALNDGGSVIIAVDHDSRTVSTKA